MKRTESIEAPPAGSPEDRIHTLLVDDHERWLEFMAEQIEAQAQSLQVTTTKTANEAIQLLKTDESIECVVSDYRMPEVDGLELLHRIRNERPGLPFILVTGQGNEQVAMDAINAGVSDYIMKDPSTEQASVFATRIERAVSEYRLRTAIEESEKRYRTVTEEIAEGIAILQDERLSFANHRLRALTGYDAGWPEEVGFFDAIAPEDRERVRQHCQAIANGESVEERAEARIDRPDGETRLCRYSARAIEYDGIPAVLLSLNDVTERRERERQLEWERDINRRLQTILVESRVREELEQEVCDLLVQYGYALAWIGRRDGDALVRGAAAGATGFLDLIEHSLQEEGPQTPSSLASRIREPQFVDAVEDCMPPRWCEAAADHGLQAGGSLPLIHNDVFYGTLAVYHGAPGVDAIERELLADLSETLAFAIHTLETTQALAAESLVQVRVSLTGPAYYLNELTAESTEVDGRRLSVEGTLPREGNRNIQFVSVDGPAKRAFIDRVASHPVVDSVRRICDESTRVQVTVDQPTPEAQLASLGAHVLGTSIDGGTATIRFELPASRDIRETLERLEDVYDSVTVESVQKAEGNPGVTADPFATDDVELTEKQANALRAAYYHGYFDQPRGNSATEVAEALGVSHSTFLQHLRVTQRKVFGSRFE